MTKKIKKLDPCPGCWKKMDPVITVTSKYGHGDICDVCRHRESGEGDFVSRQDKFVKDLLAGKNPSIDEG